MNMILLNNKAKYNKYKCLYNRITKIIIHNYKKNYKTTMIIMISLIQMSMMKKNKEEN